MTSGLATATPSTVMRRVVKVRAGKVITCPVGVRDRGPRGMEMGFRPSKVSVALVIQRSGSPVWGWTRVSVLVGPGLGQDDLPPLAQLRDEGVVQPGRLGVAVESGGRPVLGQVGDRGSVGRGGDRGHPGQRRGGLGVGGGLGEQVEGGVARIGRVRGLGGRLGVAGVLVERVPRGIPACGWCRSPPGRPASAEGRRPQ